MKKSLHSFLRYVNIFSTINKLKVNYRKLTNYFLKNSKKEGFLEILRSKISYFREYNI
jgi:hypothetical protein